MDIARAGQQLQFALIKLDIESLSLNYIEIKKQVYLLDHVG